MKEKGFTLVEMAIVLMIIGLLIGGVLRGQELMENARITKTIEQVKSYQAAVVAFRDSYFALPGDVSNATSRIPGCNAANNCPDPVANGNGDGIVGVPIPAISGMEILNQAGTLNQPNAETSFFWKHLALAHLITGIDPSADIQQPTWGKTHPAAKLGRAGFHVFYSTVAADWGTGLVLRLQLPVNAPNNGVRGQMALSPIHARMIDAKMDDGRPDFGNVAADFEGSDCDTGGVYQMTEQRNCTMYFQID